MGKWRDAGKFGLNIGLGFLSSRTGIPLTEMIQRPRRRRRRGSPDYAAIAAGIRDALQAELTDDEVEEVDLVVVEFARLAIGDRQEEVVEEEEAPPPKRKRRRKTTKKKLKS